jgi:hypothetical protein
MIRTGLIKYIEKTVIETAIINLKIISEIVKITSIVETTTSEVEAVLEADLEIDLEINLRADSAVDI